MVYDVIIAGAGPVGLFLACELRLAKLSVLVLERSEDPHSPLKRLPFGMRGLWGPSVEAFHRRGLLEQIASQSRADEGAPDQPRPGSIAPGSQRRGPGGHFAGIQFDASNVDSSRWAYRLPGPAETQLGVETEHLERVLSVHAHSLGVEIRRGCGVDGFEASDDEVTVHTGDQRIRSRWLVGCDGGRSTVRKQGGFEFVGTEPEFTGYSVQVDIADPSVLPMGRHHGFFPFLKGTSGMYTQWQPGTIAIADFDGGASHRTAPITLEHVQAVLRRVSGTDVTLKALHVASTWTDRAMQATTYRKGRVLLAGDAAHIHSPLGGQGLNLGFGDAVNLGWKLAATIRGDAPDGLLDSYTAERHPVGARILDWSRAQVALMQSHPLQAIVRDLIDTRDGATYFAERVWGVVLRYDLGEGHPLVGRSCPDFELEDGTRLGVLLRDGKGVLLDFHPRSPLRSLASRRDERVKYVASKARDHLGLTAVLVRPDGFVAWACDGEPDLAEASRAASRWFAQPTVVSSSSTAPLA
ncbi:FAD-dependent monooxygenase [Singulisphaera acidiphila]|uniref:2-polyprenyl-6-methoxyphenol hydroxylase-like oxidoreductase n=1 Tax=Singulisphaera acidiphila (strain ATCC BAA-1392 / DSM 18658 / VKM B-2454 / MOB10) TaxID=886293 RepID=L0DC54_SINAD|nr:FAD-dependent monooxygenase [Singulisphaera acidiphila]AGA26403.1 2-polyprenyl-6-methoxyphenol hydroxylase-like oxidoreductase [Singulisphaera acidiphila DSM 18658]